MNNYFFRIAVALLLAGSAAILNYLWIRQNVPQTDSFAVFVKDVAVGQEITKDDVTSVPLPRVYYSNDTQVNLENFFVSAKDRYSLVGLIAHRNFKRGQLILNSDKPSNDYLPDADILGPFRLLSIGNQISGMPSDSVSMSGSGRTPITIIMTLERNPKTNQLEFSANDRRLFQLIDLEKSTASNSDDQWKLMNITIYPDTPGDDDVSLMPLDDSGSTGYVLKENERAIIVDVPNVPMLSRVMMNSQTPRIGFRVPSDVVRSQVMKNPK